MNALLSLETGKTYDPCEPRWQDDSGGLLDLRWDDFFSPRDLRRRPANLWRYRESLPITDDRAIVSFQEGHTPLLALPLGQKIVHIKQDYLFPTSSYKDRGATVLVSQIKSLGIRRVVQDSSGNAGCAVAAYCAAGRIDCDIYVPAHTSRAKISQIRAYGSSLHLVPGDRSATAAAALDAAQSCYYASHCWNPYFLHGTKTFAFEVWEQLGFRSPDVCVLPAGNGTLLLGAFIGFSELLAAGYITRLPQIIAVQAQNCAPLHQAFIQGSATPATVAAQETLAEGIAIARPVRGAQILQAVRASAGYFIAVQEQDIKQAWISWARKGFYLEPTAAATLTGLQQVLPQLDSGQLIVSVMTGHGLKYKEGR